MLLAFSCKRRGVCPSCGAKRAVKFAEHLYAAVLEDVPHGSTELAEVRHIIFTIPKRIRTFFKYDRRLLSILFEAAREALKDVLTKDGGTIGAILTAQTAGEALNFTEFWLTGFGAKMMCSHPSLRLTLRRST